ncbi:DnaJ domain-containing protein, partial [Schizothecium vesticola]
MACKTYYEMLGVASGASAQDIRKAFLKLSLKAHPDKVGNTPEVNDAFIALKEAYETLSDTEKRQEYDL